MKLRKLVAVGLIFLVTSFTGVAQTDPFNTSHSLMQVSIINALLAGEYDGSYKLSDLLKHGDFGLGTFDKLDGEMIVLNGKIYQFKTDEKMHNADLSLKTPFACVVHFRSDYSFEINKEMDIKSFQNVIDSVLSNPNLFYAIKVTGNFKYIKTRSVPKQSKPYKPLSEVTKTQSVFEKNNQEGTIVAFLLPAFINGVNVPGFHMHFITKDKTFGGHALDFILSNGKVEIEKLNKFEMLLPEEGSSFKNLDLGKDRSKELEKVEK